jgi:hypothetical protein
MGATAAAGERAVAGKEQDASLTILDHRRK